MNVGLLRAEEREAYETLAQRSGSIFSQLAWLELFGDDVRVLALRDSAGQLIGGFSLYEERRLGLRINRNPPFTPSAGPFLRVNAKNPVEVMSAWKRALSAIAEFLEPTMLGVVSVALGRNIVDTQPFIWRRFKVVPAYTYVIDLQTPGDGLRRAMSAERRNDISKALRDGLTVEQTTDPELVWRLVQQTYTRQHMSADETAIKRILNVFANPQNSFAFAVKREGAPIAAAFCVHDRQTAYYVLGGYDSTNRHHGAGALAIQEAIFHAQSLNLERFDFEGSMEGQIERFFRGFGGVLTPYFRVNKAALPLEMALKVVKRDLF
jgi:hypothetical protein